MTQEANKAFVRPGEPVTDRDSALTDWRFTAGNRLARLVELEHDYAVMRSRLEQLQVEHRMALDTGEGRMRRIHELEKWRDITVLQLSDLRQRLVELTQQKAAVEASFLGSRSWRLTRPLRLLSAHTANGKYFVGRMLQRVLRVPLIRGFARAVARRMPRLGQRIRSRLYPGAGTK